MLTRYNKKTVTVITDTGLQWTVSPSVLSRVKPTKDTNTAAPNVALVNKH
jgi:hypothetical protein